MVFLVRQQPQIHLPVLLLIALMSLGKPVVLPFLSICSYLSALAADSFGVSFPFKKPEA